MSREPQLSDFIYEEIRQCENYALLNMITFEAAIRNEEVRSMINDLNAVSSEDQLDAILNGDDKFSAVKVKLRENYFFDYDMYVEYTRVKSAFLETYSDEKSLDPEYQKIVDRIQEEYEYDTDYKIPSTRQQVELYKKYHAYNVIVNHDEHTSHTHHLSLPLYRPKMHIPQKTSIIHIEIPMYHIHPKDIANYYASLADKHMTIMSEAKEYYIYEELFYDKVDEKESKAETFALMFFVWDYVKWWKEYNGAFTPDETARTVYSEIAKIIGADVNDRTGRSSKVEKYIEAMNKLISKCEYKKFYTSTKK
jgi:hypothetical protein